MFTSSISGIPDVDVQFFVHIADCGMASAANVNIKRY